LIKSAQNWLYLKLDKSGTDILNIPNQGWYFYNAGAGSYYCPESLRIIVSVEKDEGEELQLISTNCQSYPWTCNNLIMTAMKYEELKQK